MPSKSGKRRSESIYGAANRTSGRKRHLRESHGAHQRPQDTADKLRTEPLWGLRTRPRFMHDLRSLTLQNAIERHRGEAEHAVRGFQRLAEAEKQQLISFLETL
jgi:CxxC motif-containing protein (DUF1111 family)